MAAPFYSQADQDIYASGQQYIPQEQYRLNYTPPSIMGQNTNAGIASTNVAKPYIWPPKGPPAGGQEDLYQLPDRYDPNENLGTTNITDYEAKIANVGPTWGGTWAQLKDAYFKLPTPLNLIMKRVEKYKADKAAQEEEDEELAAQTRTRAINKMKEKYKDPNYIPITTGGGADIIPINGGTTDDGGVNGGVQTQGQKDTEAAQKDDPGLGGHKKGGRIGYGLGDIVKGWFSGGPESETNPTVIGTQDSLFNRANIGLLKDAIRAYEAQKVMGELDPDQQADYDLKIKQLESLEQGAQGNAQGGRIGYRYGDPVIPEDETEDVFELMRDQNIPISEQVEGDPFQMRIQELMGKGLSYDDAYDIAEMEFQDLFAEGSEQDQGLASLV